MGTPARSAATVSSLGTLPKTVVVRQCAIYAVGGDTWQQNVLQTLLVCVRDNSTLWDGFSGDVRGDGGYAPLLWLQWMEVKVEGEGGIEVG